MFHKKYITTDGREIDFSDLVQGEYADSSDERKHLSREQYFLDVYGSLHNTYLAFRRIQDSEGREPLEDDIGDFLDMLQMVIDRENSK